MSSTARLPLGVSIIAVAFLEAFDVGLHERSLTR